MDYPVENQRIKIIIDTFCDGNELLFSKEIGVSQPRINRLFNIDNRSGKYPLPSLEIIQSIINKFVNVSSEWLLSGRGKMLKDEKSGHPLTGKPAIHSATHLQNVATHSEVGCLADKMPQVVTVDSSGRNNIVLLDIQAAAGLPGNLQNPEYFKKLPAFTLPGYIYQQGSYIAIQIGGDSMHPTILHSDYVIAKELDGIRRIRNGYIYVVVTLDSVLCKRVYHIDDTSYIEIVSDNDTYPMDTIPLNELQRLYEVDSRLSTNLRNYNNDIRRDIAEMKTEMSELKRQIILHTGNKKSL